MENQKDIFKNHKMLILDKKNKLNFEAFNVFKEEDCIDSNKIEKIYQNYMYHGIDNTSINTMLIQENNYDIKLYNVWKMEGFFFLSEEKYSETYEDFVRFQVMSNDFDLIPKYLLNYAKKYEKLSEKQEFLSNANCFCETCETEESEKLLEEISDLLDNACRRADKECYLGEMLVLEIG